MHSLGQPILTQVKEAPDRIERAKSVNLLVTSEKISGSTLNLTISQRFMRDLGKLINGL